MLSLPDDWNYSSDSLELLSSDGLSAVKSGLRELEAHHYLVRSQSYSPTGTFAGYDYDVYELPYSEKPNAVKPSTEKPSAENPSTENPTTYINTIYTNSSKELTKETNTKKVSTKKETMKEIGVAPELESDWEEFLKYRSQKKKPLETRLGMQRAYSKLMELSGGNFALAKEIISQSIENEWLSFYPPKQDYGTTPISSSRVSSAAANSAAYEEAGRRIDALLAEKIGGSNS